MPDCARPPGGARADERRRAAHQKRRRDHQERGDRREDLKRGPPVARNEPRRQGRHGHGRHAHARRHERHGKAALRSNQPVTQAIIGAIIAAALPPTRSPKTTGMREAMSPESEARCRQGRSPRSGRSRADRTGRRARPRPCCRTPWRGSRWSWRSTRRSPTSRHPGDRPQENRQRKHRTDRDAATRSIRGSTSDEYQLVGIDLRSQAKAEAPTVAGQGARASRALQPAPGRRRAANGSPRLLRGPLRFRLY